ncbi:Periplasmic trehalase precursor [Cognatishimia activa]|uniref:Periplasmic trehalase n=1 Tax=Cognatishimia activa TaxID=1715691 RepID=A0A0P1IV50_9RHOB|nr:trehalase family glycosidase [Cognatishimia activa]CUK27489.1 Periplasmic trehalase precursor [Cognatishimia activa]
MTVNDALTVWCYGQLFAFSGLDGQTDYRGGLVAQTIEDGLMFRQPGLAKLNTSRVHSAEFGSDWANLETENGTVRLCFIDANHLLIAGAVRLEELDDEFSMIILKPCGDGFLMSTRGASAPPHVQAIDELQHQRRKWVRKHLNKVAAPYSRLAGKALNQMKNMVCAPEGQIPVRTASPDRYPHRDIWLWDSVFHSIGFRHLDIALAREMILGVFAAQLPSGQIPISFHPYATRTHRSQPPILAWGITQLLEVDPDPSWVPTLVEPLKRYLQWFETHRMIDGLFGWVGDDGHLGSVCDESGMDNSPRFFGEEPLQAVDLCCYMAQEYQAMAQLDPNGDWQAKANAIKTKIHRVFWNDELGFYSDRNPAIGKTTGVQAVTGFLPLILDTCPSDHVAALSASAKDRARFGTKLPLPAIAKTDPNFAKDMWQGPVWINMNWMIARGFARSGEPELARDIRHKTLDAMQADYLATGSIFEYYDDDHAVTPPQLLRKGKTDSVIDPKNPSIHLVIHDYGWSATLALDWIIRGEV